MSSHAPTNPTSPLTKNALYITLNFLYYDNTSNKYHWGLLATDQSLVGTLYHATDTHRTPMNLIREVRLVKNPQLSKTMVVVLKIADSPGADALNYYSSPNIVHLMDHRYIPQGELRWTCRVWVKEVLKRLHANNYIRLPMDIDTLEQWCQYAADRNIQHIGRAKVYNDLSWTSKTDTSGGGSSSAVRPYYGPKPMLVDSTGHAYYGPKPMQIDSTGQAYYGPKPMQIDSTGQAYYGPKPMQIDSTGQYYYSTNPADVDSSHHRRV